MGIDGKAWLQAMLCFVCIVGARSCGPFLYAQTQDAPTGKVPEKPPETCLPCRSVEPVMKKARVDADASKDAAQQGFREPDELSLQDVKKALADGNACVAATPPPEGEKDLHCGLRLKEVQAFLPKLQAVKSNVESAQARQSRLLAALQALAPFRTLPPDGRLGLPPQDPCQQCNDIWENMKGVMTFASSGIRFVRKVENGKAVAEADALYAQASAELCPRKDKILNSHVNTERLAYYNWTQTFSTYTKLKDALQSRAVIAFCQ